MRRFAFRKGASAAVCENATDMYSESCVAITAAQHGDDPHRPSIIISPPAFFFTSTVRRHRDDSAHKRVLDVFTLAAWSDRSGVTVHSPT